MEIESTADALKYLYNLSLNESSFRFRGQADNAWPLKPSIYRSNNFQRYQTVQYEKNLLLAKPQIPDPPLTHTTYDLEWLMLCQHYGIPTRLIDWSTDILIALFFSCSDETQIDKDGALFVCNQNDYPIFTVYDKSIMEVQKLAFVSTNVINPRLRIQSGNFMMWGHSPLDENETESYDLWQYHKTQDASPFLEKICIPKNSKRNILNELEHIYSITNNNIYLKNGYLERTYKLQFDNLKEIARLMTLYTTDADRLNKDEEIKARSMFKNDCRNMFGGCIRLSKM